MINMINIINITNVINNKCRKISKVMINISLGELLHKTFSFCVRLLKGIRNVGVLLTGSGVSPAMFCL